MIPQDPAILLSYINTQLRDYFSSLDSLCEERELSKEEITEKLAAIDYHYDEVANQFV